jgi:hypothetical protein
LNEIFSSAGACGGEEAVVARLALEMSAAEAEAGEVR